MLWMNQSISEMISALDTDINEGLTEYKTKERIKKYGLNEFARAQKVSLLEKILHHLREITSIILLIAVGISAYMAVVNGEGWTKVIVILSIVIINITLAIYQESRSEKALEALKELNFSMTTVIRNGNKIQVNAKELVPGDIVELTSGDMSSADMRLIESNFLQVEESSLTGESLPIEKDHSIIITENVPLGDRLNMVYSGCLITQGKAKAVVVATGMDTEIGKIAGLLSTTDKLKTPLQIRLNQLSTRLCIVALIAGFVIFCLGVLLHNESLPDMLLIAISLGVAAVPETLPIIVTMTLSYGVHNMVRKNTIIRRIPAIETIGNTSIICSDKTGTLTQNKMQIQSIWHVGSAEKKVDSDFTAEEIKLVELLAACSNAIIKENAEKEEVIGDPTEAAIIRLLHDKGLTRADLDKAYPRVFEIPFDSTRKIMTTVHYDRIKDKYIIVTKGAFDRIPVKQNEKLIAQANLIHDSFAQKALRVIAVGYKIYDNKPEELTSNELEKDLQLRGLVGMIDPPREESKQAVCHAKKAGIRTVMITGDHVMTAEAVAKDIGIFTEGDKSVTGHELNQMTDAELRDIVKHVSVYARVSSEDKIRIVQAWQFHGEVITMTGDGVNDAPALKAADVGAAMGITGTEVSKNAADMVITDDNFSTIVAAIKEGRTSFDNIIKTIYFLLSVNFSQIFIMLTGVAMGWGAPLTALQILLINVVSDGIPGFFLSFEKGEQGIMARKPIRRNQSIFSNGLGFKIAFRAVVFSILTLVAFIIGMFVNISDLVVPSREVGVSMAFIVLSFASVINIFNVRSEQSIFRVGFYENKGIFWSACASVSITLLISLLPFLANIFQVVSLSYKHWLVIMSLGVSQLLIGELEKFAIKNKGR